MIAENGLELAEENHPRIDQDLLPGQPVAVQVAGLVIAIQSIITPRPKMTTVALVTGAEIVRDSIETTLHVESPR